MCFISGTTEELFQVSVWPNQALVEFGQSLTINCSTTCPEPGPSGVETFLKKTQLSRGPQWKEFLLEDVTENSVLQCFFSCLGVQKETRLDITMYREYGGELRREEWGDRDAWYLGKY